MMIVQSVLERELGDLNEPNGMGFKYLSLARSFTKICFRVLLSEGLALYRRVPCSAELITFCDNSITLALFCRFQDRQVVGPTCD
jgi:hypothetical protein